MAENKNTYITGSDSFKSYASQNVADFGDELINRGSSRAARTFLNHDTNISVRSDYNRNDYEYFRPSYTVPQKQKDIISMCMEAYQKVGLVRNVIDLMSDFGAQGIRLQHTVPSTQEFYNSWWNKIGGASISERFLNLLYRAGQTIIHRHNGKVSVGAEKRWKKSKAEDVKLEKVKVLKREIPLKYTFIDILSVDTLAPDLVSFVGQPVLVLKISTKLRSALNTATKLDNKVAPEVKKMIEKIPKDIVAAIAKGQNYIPLDPEKVGVYYYKKDDWMLWANPMCYAILDDLLMLNKLKLADISALDGAISNIRLWKLGIIGDSPNNSILPTKAAINKLRSILANNVGGGVLDLVWGPELSFEESNTQVWRFLGAEKYATTINAIYEGLGIPAPLRAGSGLSNTANFIGLNTLVKRLQYGRDRLVEFWNKELKYVHKAMGFPGKPPQIVFDFMALADEAAEKQLLINLWDRDIISDETILELFGRLPHIEKSRVKRENNDRSNDVMPHKASPYHNPDKEHDYKKILLQGGGITPSEIGLELSERKKGEKTRLEIMEKTQLKLKSKDNQTGLPGRPLNITETKKRKPKPTEKPSTKANFIDLFLWAGSAQEKISDLATKGLLESLNKTSVRSLSKKEFNLVEKVKLNVLCDLLPFSEINEEVIYNSLISNTGIDKTMSYYINELKVNFVARNKRPPKVEETRQIYASAYALFYEGDDDVD